MAGSPKSAEEDWDFAHLGIHETQYLTHFFHHWTAKFIPQIPARIIEQHTREGDAVLDPFMGCGTTLVEAAVRRRPAFGTDINPLAVKIARAKTAPVDEAALQCFLSELARLKRERSEEGGDIESVAAPGDCELFGGAERWFRGDVAAAIRWVLDSIGHLDDATRNFAEVGLSDLLKGMSNARMDRTIPQLPPEPEYVDKKHYNRVVNNLTRPINVYGRLHSQLRRMLDALQEYRGRADGTTCEPMLADARKLGQHVPRVKLAVTSPPTRTLGFARWLSCRHLLRIQSFQSPSGPGRLSPYPVKTANQARQLRNRELRSQGSQPTCQHRSRLTTEGHYRPQSQ